MKFSSRLITGKLIQRYKRFLADIELDNGKIVTAHCANPGAMLGLTRPGNRVFLSKSDDPKRKLAYSWELVEADFGAGPVFVGINTSLPNRLVEEAIHHGRISQLLGYSALKREVKYGINSRIDLLLQSEERPPCYVEVKNVHMMRQPGRAEFPDCVTARGTKHLEELTRMVAHGARAVMLYAIQMPANSFSLAQDIDTAYATAFQKALTKGVEVYAYTSSITPEEIIIDRCVPLIK